ncbi:MAG: N-acetylmuramoyl-L-alanine amidase, partial [Planctomycetes bacterium]|nr:N-acetylmuramoyl-L-alanine amidase [Planctomycetota bacterium]
RAFQRQSGLPIDGIAGPETQDALVREKAEQSGRSPAINEPPQRDATVPAADQGMEQFLGSLWPFGSLPRITDRTAYSPKDKRKRTRDLGSVYALVLHQTGFSRGNEHKRYNKVTAHFVILPNGDILQLHPMSAYLYSSNGFNRGSVSVEIVGNLPSDRGRCWKPERFGCNELTSEQVRSGRYLIRYLIKKIGLTHVLAHRQSSGTRGNDPGPDVWYRIGQWAVDKLGLDDGGPGFKIHSGNPIPKTWRTWNR